MSPDQVGRYITPPRMSFFSSLPLPLPLQVLSVQECLSVYRVPLLLKKQKLLQYLVTRLDLPQPFSLLSYMYASNTILTSYQCLCRSSTCGCLLYSLSTHKSENPAHTLSTNTTYTALTDRISSRGGAVPLLYAQLPPLKF